MKKIKAKKPSGYGAASTPYFSGVIMNNTLAIFSAFL